MVVVIDEDFINRPTQYYSKVPLLKHFEVKIGDGLIVELGLFSREYGTNV